MEVSRVSGERGGDGPSGFEADLLNTGEPVRDLVKTGDVRNL